MFEIGASLREARIKRGLSPQDVHKAIRIRDRYLQALEEERWELLPGDAYVKGFLRTYADFLGLDANLYVDEYTARFAQREEQLLAPQPMPRRERRRLGGDIGILRPLLAIVAIAAVVAAVAAWQLSRGSRTSSPPATTTGTTGSTTTTKKKRTPPPVTFHRAVFTASRGPCWLEIRAGDAHGKIVYENTLRQGQRLPVSLSTKPVWISFGDAANLDLRLGGKLAHLPPLKAGGTVLLSKRGLEPA